MNTARLLRCLRSGLVFVGTVGLLMGCAHRPKEPPTKTPAALPALLVGTVRLVDEGGRFVLIDSGAHPSPIPGGILKTEASDGPPAELKAGEIRRRPFAIADVVAGTPRVGQRVYQQPR